MKKLFFALFVVLFATTVVAQTGLTCEDPIPVDERYESHVDVDPEVGYKEVWYTAWSYDLPMHVYFSPDSMNSTWGPEVEIDFSCTGDYSFDRKLDSVVNILEAISAVQLPVGFLCDKVVRDGKVEWDLSIDEKYRNHLTEYGLTHNVQAFVKVIYTESGSIRLTPDTAFQSCIEHGHYAQLGDTIDIVANDSNKMIVLPYSEWKNDSIRFVWIGDKPARVWVADEDCRFTPMDASRFVRAKYDIDSNTPKKLYTVDMENAIDNWIGAGIFYAKVLSEGTGQLVIERIPLGEIQGDAILLEHGKPINLQANDDRVFCFPRTWKSTEFLANTQYLMDMHVSNISEFEIGDANVITKYAFSKDGSSRKLQLSTADISALGVSATDDYVYVRFQCNADVILTPSLWNASSCIDNTILVTSGQTFSVEKNSKNVYRLVYDDWKNYDFTMAWTGKVVVSSLFASYCNFTSTASDALYSLSIRGGKSVMVASNEIDNWAVRIEDGFVYFRLVSSRVGDMTMTSFKPAEEDPEIITNLCVESSIELKVGDQITLNLDSAFTIYRINYAEWVKQNVTFQWSGEEALHTFVAETCEFAVAPYNKYVVNYIPVSANGSFVLDAATLATFADNVDDAGYLYIRFLTEKEGTLLVSSY